MVTRAEVILLEQPVNKRDVIADLNSRPINPADAESWKFVQSVRERAFPSPAQDSTETSTNLPSAKATPEGWWSRTKKTITSIFSKKPPAHQEITSIEPPTKLVQERGSNRFRKRVFSKTTSALVPLLAVGYIGSLCLDISNQVVKNPVVVNVQHSRTETEQKFFKQEKLGNPEKLAFAVVHIKEFSALEEPSQQSVELEAVEHPKVQNYIVEEGDNLISIAKELGLPPGLDTLRQIYLLNPDKFEHPGEHQEGKLYGKKEFDRYMKIARLSPLQPGEQLKTPLPTQA